MFVYGSFSAHGLYVQMEHLFPLNQKTYFIQEVPENLELFL